MDYTKLRRGSKTERGRIIDVCLKCKKKGERTKYKNGDLMFAHHARQELSLIIDKHCYIVSKEA